MTGSSKVFIFYLVVVLIAGGTSYLQAQNPSPLNLSCSPAPCVLPNVQVSEGGMPVSAGVIAANPNNAEEFIVGTEDFNCPNFEGAAFSSNRGSSWGHACLGSAYFGVGSPVAGYDLNQNAYAGGLFSDGGDPPWGVSVSSSSNNGKSWSVPVTAMTNQLGYFTWEPWLTVDTNTTSPNKNTIYVFSSQLDTSGNTQLWVSHSSDGGLNWSADPVDLLQKSPINDAYSSAAVGADGTVYVTWLRCPGQGATLDCASSKGQILVSSSLDGGNSWSPPVKVASVSLVGNDSCFYGCLPGTIAWMSNLPSVAVSGSGSSAQLYVVFYNWTGSQMQVEVASSSNGGASWRKPVRVSKSNFGDEFFPWISIDGSGRLVATWMDRRNDANNLLYQPFVAYSTDHGLTFRGERALSSVLSNPTPGSSAFGPFGAYRNQISVGNTTYAIWMDTRTGIFQIEIGGVRF